MENQNIQCQLTSSFITTKDKTGLAKILWKQKKYCLVAWHIKEIAFSQQEI